METRWLYTTSENFKDLVEQSKGVCVIPLGCVEKHGCHLPVGTDILQVSHLAWMASQMETVCVAPDFTFGDVPENTPHLPAGSISLPLETQMLLLEQLCEQIAKNGFRKIIIYNGHGGNQAWLSAFLRKLENKPHDFVVVNYYIKIDIVRRIAGRILNEGSGVFPELTEEDEKMILKYHYAKRKDGHATFSETAYMMGLTPESVHMDRLGIADGENRGLTKKYKDMGIQLKDFGWGIDYPDAINGEDPIGCNERIGKVALRIEAERAAEAFRFIKEDEDLIRWHNEQWDTNI